MENITVAGQIVATTSMSGYENDISLVIKSDNKFYLLSRGSVTFAPQYSIGQISLPIDPSFKSIEIDNCEIHGNNIVSFSAMLIDDQMFCQAGVGGWLLEEVFKLPSLDERSRIIPPTILIPHL